MMRCDPSILCPGDCLLYAPSGVFGWLISIKTWHPISHVEVYDGNGHSLASRDPDGWFPKPHGGGVNRYPLRTSELAYVLRPTVPLAWAKARRWFETVRGQGYDWLGLLRFSWRSEYVPAKFTENKMFCSEFATRLYRRAGLDPFPRDDADAVAPAEFLTNPAFALVWRTDGKADAQPAGAVSGVAPGSGRGTGQGGD